MPPSWRYALQLAQEAANAPPVQPRAGGGWASVGDLLFIQSAPAEAPRPVQSGLAPLPAGLTPAAARGDGALGEGEAVQPPDGGVRVAQLLNESRFDLSNPNSAINSTKSPEKRALEKAAKLRSEEKKLERKLRVKAEQMRLQAAAAEEPEVGHCCVT